MKNLSFLFIGFLALTVAAFTFKPQTSKIDVQKSKIAWVGKKVTGQHNGTINFSSGTLTFDKGKLVGGNFTVDMNSIHCLDIKDADMYGKFIGHMKSDDFFGTTKFPTATFNITKVEAKGKKYLVSGDLTIKGKSNPAAFEATVNEKNGKGTAKGTLIVDRTKYDIRYGSNSFFDNLGDKAIDNEFSLELNLEFN
jgi:polyisoprenoid-binding protein YceI